ncbi:hypothetical protein TFLX_03187 [Thermoflexales bacterium]|nr:hypothetical protein TFLX_03187 [Thermoflexales bacterium]
MSEIPVATLTEQQSRAFKIFRDRCSMIETRTVLLAASGVLLFSIPGFPSVVKVVGATISSSVPFYFLLILLVMWRRTGLWWHFLNDHPGWVIFPVTMVSLGWWFVVTWDPALYPPQWLSALFILFLIAVLSIVLHQRLKSWAQSRAELERAQYGDHWIRLAEVSLRDIAFLRIPHERA